jgi:GMP synthase (glutamine-hydrolysing)
MRKLRYLLLQTRNPGDPMAAQEVRCFARVLGSDAQHIEAFDLINGAPSRDKLQSVDMVLLGGSGHHSAASSLPPDSIQNPSRPRPWLGRAFDSLREIHAMSKPTFASCWGFQAMARAMGGECVNDLANAELGTVQLTLTAEGRRDPVFGQLPSTFTGQAGHEDHVVKLPPEAVLLASTDRVREQAFCFRDRPIYCTQFHPELDRTAVLERVVAYPEYVTRIVRVPFDSFLASVQETPEANSLLRRFVEVLFG